MEPEAQAPGVNRLDDAQNSGELLFQNGRGARHQTLTL